MLKYIDIIRGLAGLFVFITHFKQFLEANYPNIWLLKPLVMLNDSFLFVFGANKGLHPAVIIFIALSGFCIHLPHAKKTSFDDAFWRNYFARRFIRIFPTYLWGCILGVIAINLYATTKISFIQTILNDLIIIVQYPFLPNIDVPLGNPVLSTVIVEMLLYVFYPIFIYTRKKLQILPLVLGVVLYCLNILFALKGYDTTWVGRNFFSFYIFWVLGAYAADWYFKFSVEKTTINLKLYNGLIIFSLGVYILLGSFVQLKGIHLLYSLILSVITAFALLTVSLLEKTTSYNNSKLVDWICKLSLVSYTIYATHFALIEIVNKITTRFNVNNPCLILLIIIVCIMLSYQFVEKPSHIWAKRLKTKA
jgi:peptidoglycan/LPS O-acetylase OafA/YrhL